MNRRYYDPARDIYPYNPFAQFQHLQIRLLQQEIQHQRITEEWRATVVRLPTEDLLLILNDVRGFFETRLPAMSRNAQGVYLGDIAITSSSQTQINIRTSYNPSIVEMEQRILALLNSGFQLIDLQSLIFTFHFRLAHLVGARSSALQENALQDVDGGPNNECLLRAILFHLLRFDSTSQILLQANRNRNGAAMAQLCAALNNPDNRSFIVKAFIKLKEMMKDFLPVLRQDYFDHLVSLFPTISVVVWLPNRHQARIIAKGINQVEENQVLHLRHDQIHQHVQIITNKKIYFGSSREKMCPDCFQFFPVREGSQVRYLNRKAYLDTHDCNLGNTHFVASHLCLVQKCKVCLRNQHVCQDFQKDEELRDEDHPYTCPECGMLSQSDQCMTYHRTQGKCQPKRTQCAFCGLTGNERVIRRHECGMNYCRTCKEIRPNQHKCFFARERKVMHDEKAGIRYFAYDIEAVLVPEGERTIYLQSDHAVQTPLYTHQINCIVVQELSLNPEEEDRSEPLIFSSYASFYQWLQDLPLQCIENLFFAHNNAKYDARMLFLAHIRHTGLLPRISWGGQRVLEMTLNFEKEGGRYYAKFRDSLFHISGPLKSFASTFGLKDSEKGWFPYKLNQFENVVYPNIPALTHFEPDSYSSKERAELVAWHLEQQGKPYDIQNELEKYCKQDVLILKKGLETYIRSAISAGSFNPLKKLTTASYCMAFYQAVHYNPKKFPIYPLSVAEEEFIQRSFHGGRTGKLIFI
jgi:hypothetical protein